MKLILLFITLISLFLVHSNAITPAPSQLPYCPSSAFEEWQYTKLTMGTSNYLEVQAASAYLNNDNGDSVGVYVKNAIGSDPFKFISLNKNTMAKI